MAKRNNYAKNAVSPILSVKKLFFHTKMPMQNTQPQIQQSFMVRI